MLKYYWSSGGSIRISEKFVPGGLATLVDPTESELDDFSAQFGINKANLLSAIDVEEPSRYEKEDSGFYLYLDVPYVEVSGNYNTVPLMIAYRADSILAVCKKSVGIVDKFLNSSGKAVDFGNKSVFHLRLMQYVIKSYQQALREIDSRRRAVHSIVRGNEKLSNGDVSLLHDLENSLVYITTSLKGIDSLLNLMKNEGEIHLDADSKIIYNSVRIEIQQALEMAVVYREIMGSTRDLIAMEINLRLSFIMKKLAILTIILTIPMIIASAYGMNVELPFQDFTLMFWFLIAVSVLAMVAAVFIMHRQHM